MTSTITETGERGIEIKHQHGVRASRGEQRQALVEAGQPERCGVGLEMAHGMRIEGGDDHRASLMRAALHRAADHRLMAKVKAVKIAQRDDCAPARVRDRAIEGQALHIAADLARLTSKSRRQPVGAGA